MEPFARPFGEVRIGPATNDALLALGHAIRAVAPTDWCAPLYTSGLIARHVLGAHIGHAAVTQLVHSGLATSAGDRVQLSFLVDAVEGLTVATPLTGWGDDVVYTGPDSCVLVELVRRHDRTGARAVELGTGSGLVATAVAATHELTIATELFHSVALAAHLTFALNARPAGHRVVTAVADVGRGLRTQTCDFVATNTPWLPAAESDDDHDRFRVGGESGAELPARFVREGAALLRPGGLAITLACDVEIDGHRPLREVCAGLADRGFEVTVEPTGLHGEDGELTRLLHHRQPRITDAVHVAVVVSA